MSLPIAVFGGSFDPVHNGHVSLVDYLLKKKIAEKVLLLPSYVPPHKQQQQSVSFRKRVAMLRLAFHETITEYKNLLQISTIEKSLPTPSYSYQTLKALQKNCQQESFAFVIGADMYNYLPKWKNYRQLIQEYQFIIFQRPDHKIIRNEELLNKEIFLNNSMWDVSSTGIRQLFKTNQGQQAAKFLPKDVFEYIISNKVYGNV